MDWLIELIKVNGMQVLPFIALYFILQGDQKKWEKRESHLKGTYEKLFEQFKAEREREFEVLNDTLEDNRIQLGMLKETLIEINHLREMSTAAFRDLFGEVRQLKSVRCVNSNQSKS